MRDFVTAPVAGLLLTSLSVCGGKHLMLLTFRRPRQLSVLPRKVTFYRAIRTAGAPALFPNHISARCIDSAAELFRLSVHCPVNMVVHSFLFAVNEGPRRYFQWQTKLAIMRRWNAPVLVIFIESS